MIETRSVSVTEEKRIVTGLVVSTSFLEAVHSNIQLDYFKNSYLRTIADWCVTFYEEHHKAPYKHIMHIYEDYSQDMHEADSELIGKLLSNLSDQYDEDSINDDYLLKSASEYFRSRELEIVVNNISILKEKGDIELAEQEIERFMKVDIAVSYDHIINLGNLEEQERILKKRDEEEKGFFQLPGDLGKYLGSHKRGDVIAFFAPAKRGKSFTLFDYFKHGVLQKKKTIMFQIEMTETEATTRVNRTIHPMVDSEEGYYPFPVFDCIKNQTGDCIDRLSPTMVLVDDELIEDQSHIPCTKCMKNEPDRYEMTTWKELIYRDHDDIFTVRKNFHKFKTFLHKYGRLSVHKKYTLTYDKVMRDLEMMQRVEGFIPDILIFDYIDILDINSSHNDYKEVDEKWKLIARVAGKTNTLVVTATQGNKESQLAQVLDGTHQGGYYGKNQHVNLMVGINQTPEEKEKGIIKYGITEARSQFYIPGKVCTVLHDLQAGQAYLDSYYKFRY